ncbi:DUF664 domain-containing protein [Pigmentiphaga sp. H8]|uniref:DinB family protein n=1 Tax=Pigmentiphaga sp. H8 TaxID=2488560 RepID=UPI000F5AB52B|nr:DUF664 domain-containing protein [Pigmentiphaga sp. H8]AZG06436.1 DUF664 domain-containing protein [Pigmentiphaga sp. H8]
MPEEFTRFLTLFDRLVRYSDDWVARMDAGKMDWAPIENASTRFGTRVSRITVRSLLIHTVLAERNWVRAIPVCEPGGVIPLPSDPAAAARFEDGDLRATALALHEENLEALGRYTPADLGRKVHFVGREWSGMGLLWGMYAHRAFHVGNIDIYLRQSDVVGPEFFEFNPAIMA